MITDVFVKRQAAPLFYGDIPPMWANLVRQVALSIFQDVTPKVPGGGVVFEEAQRRLAREFGASVLAPGRSAIEQCAQFLGASFDVWADAHGDPNSFFKMRVSLIELLFRELEGRVETLDPDGAVREARSGLRLGARSPSPGLVADAFDAVYDGIAELNRRCAEARFPFQYHNGLFQRIEDQLSADHIQRPFWSIVADAKWRNADCDMKEAVDRRDAGKGDAAFYACKALETVIKIRSDDLGRSSGNERGAANFIDNLVAERPDRFIDLWEGELLKSLYKHVRNPQGHGVGSGIPTALTPAQSTYVIESCMSWIKSLIRR